MNRSSFGGRLGTILAAVAGGVLLGGLAMPPDSLTAAQEEELRTQAAKESRNSGDGWSDDASVAAWGGDYWADGSDFG